MLAQKTEKNPHRSTMEEKLRGHGRIRTAVGAFAEPSLATRPRDLREQI